MPKGASKTCLELEVQAGADGMSRGVEIVANLERRQRRNRTGRARRKISYPREQRTGGAFVNAVVAGGEEMTYEAGGWDIR